VVPPVSFLALKINPPGRTSRTVPTSSTIPVNIPARPADCAYVTTIRSLEATRSAALLQSTHERVHGGKPPALGRSGAHTRRVEVLRCRLLQEGHDVATPRGVA